MAEPNLDDVLSGNATPSQTSSQPPPLTGSDAELLARTAVAEGDPNDPESWRNVAGVALNRAAKSGRSIAQVLSDPGQFEAYGNGHIQAVDTSSPAYQGAYQAIQPVISGKIKVPYDSFYNPAIVAQRGVTPPFDAAAGTKIGTQLFGTGYAAPAEPSLDDVLGGSGTAGATPPAAPPVASAPSPLPTVRDVSAKIAATGAPPAPPGNPAFKPGGDYGVTNAQTGQNLSDPQAKTYRAMQVAGQIDLNAALGSKSLPFAQTSPDDKPPMGVYWMDGDGVVHQPTYPAGQTALDRLGTGALQGVANVGNTLAAIPDKLDDAASQLLAKIPGAKPQTTGDLNAAAIDTRNNLMMRRVNDQVYQNSPAYGIGKVGGEVAATAPIMAATGGIGGAALDSAGLGGVSDFLGGGAGSLTTDNLLSRGASLATNGALQGGGAAALTSAGSDAPLSQQIRQGAVAGGALGPLAGVGSKVIGAGLNRLTSTAAVAPEVAQLADTAMNKYGIPLRAGQVKGAGATGDRAAAVADSNLLGSSDQFRTNNDAQKEAFTRGIASTFGENASQITPEVMQGAKDRIGGVMNDVASRTNIANADGLQTKIGSIIGEAQNVLPDNEVAPLLKQAQSIGDVREGDVIPGSAYQALTRRGAPLDRLQSSANPNVAHYAGQIRNALDDALTSSAQPEDLAALQQARFQYKNLMTVAKLAPKADVSGYISPTLLRGAVNTNFKNAAFRGAGDLGELAQIGQTFMKEPPNSFTAARAKDMLTGTGAALGALGEGGALFMHNPQLAIGTAAGLMGGAAVRKGAAALREYNFGPATTNRLITQSLNPSAAPNFAPDLRGVVAPASLGYNRFFPQQQQPAN